MDPYSADGELINLHNHFHQGQYQEAVDFDVSALSPENATAARVLQLRARVALGDADAVVSDVAGKSETVPELAAVRSLALLALERIDEATQAAEKLAAEHANNATVQVLVGTVFQALGRSEEALALLSGHSSNCRLSLLEGASHWEQAWLTRGLAGYSGSRRTHRADPSPTEPKRPGGEGSSSGAAVGAGQPTGQPPRGVGRHAAGRRQIPAGLLRF